MPFCSILFYNWLLSNSILSAVPSARLQLGITNFIERSRAGRARINRSSGAIAGGERARQERDNSALPDRTIFRGGARQDFTARRFAKILRGRISLGSPGLIQLSHRSRRAALARSLACLLARYGIISQSHPPLEHARAGPRRPAHARDLLLQRGMGIGDSFDYVRLIIPA